MVHEAVSRGGDSGSRRDVMTANRAPEEFLPRPLRSKRFLTENGPQEEDPPEGQEIY